MGNTPQMLMGRSYKYHNYNVSPLLKDFNIFYGITFVSKFPIFKVCQSIVWRNLFPINLIRSFLDSICVAIWMLVI